VWLLKYGSCLRLICLKLQEIQSCNLDLNNNLKRIGLEIIIGDDRCKVSSKQCLDARQFVSSAYCCSLRFCADVRLLSVCLLSVFVFCLIPGNDIRQTNVPDVRIQYRAELLGDEFRMLHHHTKLVFDDSLIDRIM
jgi:hypothetical protein